MTIVERREDLHSIDRSWPRPAGSGGCCAGKAGGWAGHQWAPFPGPVLGLAPNKKLGRPPPAAWAKPVLFFALDPKPYILLLNSGEGPRRKAPGEAKGRWPEEEIICRKLADGGLPDAASWP